jgi:hypothetical protein
MKNFSLFFFLFFTVELNAQQLEMYTASNGKTYKIGDEIKLGRGSGQNGTFVCLTLGGWGAVVNAGSNMPTIPSNYSGMVATIKKIKKIETQQGKVIFSVFLKKTMNTTNFNLDIEDAIITCEIADCKNKDIAPITIINSPSKFDELKKLKELFDSGVITEQEYNIEKGKLLK